MSTHPYYTKATLAMEIAGNPIGTDVGIQTVYTKDLIWIPRDLHSSSTSLTSDVRPYKNTYCYQDTDRFSGNQASTSWSTSSILPFKDVLIIDGLLTEHFDVNNQYSRSKFLFEDSAYEYYAGFNCRYSFGSFKYIQLAFGILRRTKSDGTMAVYAGSNLVYIANNLPSGVTDSITAIAYLNSWLSSVDYFFITPYRSCNANSLNVTDNAKQLVIGIKFDDGYDWIIPNAFSFNLFSFDASDLIKDEGYEPEPEPPGPSDDPYNPGGYSGGGGGPNSGGTGATGTGGLHDDTSDPIPIPIPPTDIITSAGLITAYNPSASQLANFANKLWNGDPTTIGDWFRLLFGGDAFNAIIGLHLLPVSPATSGSPVNIKLGNWDTEAVAPKITNQYVQHTFGTLMLPEYWGNCIDYAPYTKIQLALPYIGIVDVDTDDVLGSENTLTYNIDVYSGALCAMLRCIKGNLLSVIYQWSGSCGVGIPITGADKSAILSTVVAGSAITGAAGAIGGIPGAVAANAALAGTAASSYGTMKGKVQKQGNFSPNSGAMGIMTPYFILTRPVQSVPSSWQADKGYPANISAQLGTLTGYTEVSEINLECSGTEAEKKEIIDLLKKGVLF